MTATRGLVRIVPVDEHTAAAVIVERVMPRERWEDFKAACREFGAAYEERREWRVVDRPQASALYRWLRRRGFRVELAPELEDVARGSVATLEDLVAIARPIFCARMRPAEPRGIEGHFVDLLQLPVERLALLDKKVIAEVGAAAIAVESSAGARYPELAAEARELAVRCRIALKVPERATPLD